MSAPDVLVVTGVAAGLILAACGTAPPRAETPAPKPAAAAAAPRDSCVDDPTPLKREYTGVAAKARCDREVYTIMGGVVHSLGVECWYCHEKDDYPAMTERKRIANWMATELIPSLRAKTGEDIWCQDCHVRDGNGTAKILGEPRDRPKAIEFMTTHLTEKFEASNGEPLRCRTCHLANLGSPGWNEKVILTDHLPPRPPRAAPPSRVEPEPPAVVDGGAPPVDGSDTQAGDAAAP